MLDSLKRKEKLQDLPFGKDDVGTRFVILVIIMMTALATLALGGAEIILSLRGGWVDAIKGQVTIEIPAADSNGAIRGADMLEEKATAITRQLQVLKPVSFHQLKREEVAKLIEPWMGEEAASKDLPLPALIGITFRDEPDEAVIAKVQEIVKGVDASAMVETHQTWLDDLRRFSGVMLAAAAFMALAVVACCILCVSGAVNAQLASHQADIDLLHLMGATDNYIGAQFVKVVAADVGRAAFMGTVIGVVFLKVGGMIVGGLQAAMIPGFSWNFLVWLSFLTLPLVITGLCFVAARVTVLQTLQKMP